VGAGAGGTVREFLDQVASREPTPGGGAASAHVAALAAALAAMVAGLTVGRKKYAAVDAEMRDILRRSEGARARLEKLVEEDSAAFEEVMRLRKTPANNEMEVERKAGLELEALWKATRVPLDTARAAAEVLELAGELAGKGNRNAASDAGVAILMSQAAGRGALFNVAINLRDLPEGPEKEQVRAAARGLKQALTRADSMLSSLELALAGDGAAAPVPSSPRRRPGTKPAPVTRSRAKGAGAGRARAARGPATNARKRKR
jgi:glutamate formiminotransferase/formiminotetrahydrofolate cyclodeaminase